jgi:hypothetical protein
MTLRADGSIAAAHAAVDVTADAMADVDAAPAGLSATAARATDRYLLSCWHRIY